MSFDANKRRENSKNQARDAQGHFIKNPTNSSNYSKEDSSFDEPLVYFSIHNPFKKVLYWLNDIRKHQTTTFDFKIKIPLIALPIFLAVIGAGFQLFFNLGKQKEQQAQSARPTPTPVVIMQPTKPPEPVLISRTGILKATYQVTGILSPTTAPVIPSEREGSPSPTTTTPTQMPTPSRYVLVGRLNQTIFLIAPSNISLNNYLNLRVLVTGLYDKATNTLKIAKSSDIEILP